VHDDWQGKDLESSSPCLVQIAPTYDFKHLKAGVFCDNVAMNNVFENSNIPYKRKAEFGVYSYIFDLK
jgi:hypothetical protein